MLPLLFLRAREAMVSRFRHVFREGDLTATQWRTLRVLNDHEWLSFSHLSAEAVIPKPSLSRIIVNLEQRELIERSEPEDDQRQLHLHLTDTGRKLVKSLAPLIEAEYEAIEALVGEETISKLSNQIHELSSNLEADNRKQIS